MMTSTSSGMEVDPPSTAASSHPQQPPRIPTTNGNMHGVALVDHLGLNPLKRSNSAPMLASTAAENTQTRCSSPVLAVSGSYSHSLTPTYESFPRHFERIRRYSASSATLFSPSTPVKTPSRLAQIINEERINVKEREEAHERETHTNLLISTSCDELSLSDPSDPEPMVTEVHKRPRSFQEPLHIFTSPYPYASSPSPTRIGKQCFSPSLCQPVRNTALSPSPSPTRKTFSRRSISPISMAPTRIMLKRKIIMDSEMSETPNKRYQPSFTCISPGCSSTPNNSHPLSISSSSLSDGGSPDQMVPTPHLHKPLAQSSNHVNRLLSGGVSIPSSSSPSNLLHNNVFGQMHHSSSANRSINSVPSYVAGSNNSLNSPQVSTSSVRGDNCTVNHSTGQQNPQQLTAASTAREGSFKSVIKLSNDNNNHHHHENMSVLVSPSTHTQQGTVQQVIRNTAAAISSVSPASTAQFTQQQQHQQQPQHSPMMHSDSFHQHHSHHNDSHSNVFGFHPVQDSLDSMSTLSSLSHESDTSDMNDMTDLDSGGLGDSGNKLGNTVSSGSHVVNRSTVGSIVSGGGGGGDFGVIRTSSK